MCKRDDVVDPPLDILIAVEAQDAAVPAGDEAKAETSGMGPAQGRGSRTGRAKDIDAPVRKISHRSIRQGWGRGALLDALSFRRALGNQTVRRLPRKSST
ncbi:hypothetical protein GCM10011505_41660 [Tistrella bauzanensis]|uniref:Uncharacterized protein n=1 Tax=Tistrella bauzanensis TaxID=657419 RepID=A0ABQ1J2G6_9PROT|nr:hypothetical protein GCM10011505_41660 [Tistrella bauzanensis]